MKSFKILAAVLAVLTALCLALVSCNGSETSETKPEQSSQAPDNSTTPTESSKTPESSETPSTTESSETPSTTESTGETTEPDVPDVPKNPAEQYLDDHLSDWMPNHMELTLHSKKDTLGVEHEYVLLFTIKSEGGNFRNDEETGTPGLQFSQADCMFIKDWGVNGDDEAAEYVKYEIDYYATEEWWRIYASPKDWVPQDGHQYEFYLFITCDLEHSVSSESLVYWELGELWTYNAPVPVVSQYGDIAEMIPDIAARMELVYHDKFNFGDEDTAANRLHFTFKMDNNPFEKREDQEGLSFTLLGDVYIDGQKVKTANYETKDWYQIYFDVLNEDGSPFEFTSGKTYEFIIAIDANDEGSGACHSQDGYFIFYNYVCP